jgi:hypothetical protein
MVRNHVLCSNINLKFKIEFKLTQAAVSVGERGTGGIVVIGALVGLTNCRE